MRLFSVSFRAIDRTNLAYALNHILVEQQVNGVFRSKTISVNTLWHIYVL